MKTNPNEKLAELELLSVILDDIIDAVSDLRVVKYDEDVFVERINVVKDRIEHKGEMQVWEDLKIILEKYLTAREIMLLKIA